MTTYKPVLTKRDFVRRYAQGEFGNCSPTWNDLDDWFASVGTQPNHRKFHIRSRVPGGPTHYNLTVGDVPLMWNTSHTNQAYISEMCPTEQTLLQGEVMQTERGLYLYYSTVAKPMRDALKEESREARGLLASALLSARLCPNSSDWLTTLFDRYPQHVIEFTTLSRSWGTLSNFNTLFWEVRLY